ncbi:zinc ribbon domain-containing protein [Oscillatoria sp. FACHB-1406]|uniref:zinc ribbon domain-containing protein n=1 Tax=Oscillatoria sp. FACHB-1406 TaxID=2692846 RepID=UPI001683ED85|nr:zinc ribbon domain-containing protein [Oscillatoria sp. FACHB-1406]MBD2579080.1 zinc ribbon domain-containing protein [Oscillatoria sp. FACHB-1406]
MAYSCELRPGQNIYLDNSGGQTTIATSTGSPGQQQQSSRTFETGNWTAKPELFETSSGVILKLTSDRGETYIRLQGSSASPVSSPPSLALARSYPLQEVSSDSFSSSIPSMKPMEPMKPMKMGDLSAKTETMEMRSGNMAMRMEAPSPQSTRHFCSQCGASIAPEDRFCSHCGHKLH